MKLCAIDGDQENNKMPTLESLRFINKKMPLIFKVQQAANKYGPMTVNFRRVTLSAVKSTKAAPGVFNSPDPAVTDEAVKVSGTRRVRVFHKYLVHWWIKLLWPTLCGIEVNFLRIPGLYCLKIIFVCVVCCK